MDGMGGDVGVYYGPVFADYLDRFLKNVCECV